MAEKEEYIAVSQTIVNIDDSGRAKLCDFKSYSRQEAIERMAKALRSNIVETQAQCSCLNMAEVALNALLEGK